MTWPYRTFFLAAAVIYLGWVNQKEKLLSISKIPWVFGIPQTANGLGFIITRYDRYRF